ncbi:hypothetical protein [Polynucleobacter sp.]
MNAKNCHTAVLPVDAMLADLLIKAISPVLAKPPKQESSMSCFNLTVPSR